MKDAIKKASKTLKEGGIIIYPTDTVYGIGCNAFNKKSVEKIREIKGSDSKPFSVAVNGIEGVHAVAKVNEWQEETLSEKLPGPYTFVLEKKSFISDNVSRNGIGVRIPDHEHCLALLESVDFPLVTTSANLSGRPPARSVKEIPKEILDRVDFVLDAGELAGKPSTVVDLKKNSWKVLRT